jgi:hypothetical protein
VRQQPPFALMLQLHTAYCWKRNHAHNFGYQYSSSRTTLPVWCCMLLQPASGARPPRWAAAGRLSPLFSCSPATSASAKHPCLHLPATENQRQGRGWLPCWGVLRCLPRPQRTMAPAQVSPAPNPAATSVPC